MSDGQATTTAAFLWVHSEEEGCFGTPATITEVPALEGGGPWLAVT